MSKRHAYFPGDFKTRDEPDGEMYIEGYFAVFNQETELWPGWYEQIKQRAFEKSLKNNDIRCLFNHDTGFVLGRNTNQTLELREDSHGLFGRVKINPKDTQAVDVYARVNRGDISGCSFGFECKGEERQGDDSGDIHWVVTEADLFEVSICTFPAYPQTEIQARKQAFEQTQKQRVEEQKRTLKQRLEEIRNGA